MPTRLHPAQVETFLTQRYGAGISAVAPIGAGEWSQAFSFDRQGRGYVVRFGAHGDDFERDRFAARFSSPVLPVPQVVDFGEAFGGYYAVSERMPGRYIDGIDEAQMRVLLPAMMMMQLYYPGSAQPPAELSLSPNGRLRIVAPPHDMDRASLAPLLKALRMLGLWSHAALIQQPPTGHAIHYAGTLPMRTQPGAYQCYPDGRLHGTRRVFVADSASFPTLPAKNMSFGMMANAMRIAALAAIS